MSRSLTAIALLVLLLAAWPARAEPPSVYERLGPDLSCTTQFGICDTVRQGGTLPIILEFQNSGEARSVRVRTGPRVRIEGVFSLPAGRPSRHFLYVPVPSDIRYGIRQFEFRDAESGSLLDDPEVYNATRLSYARSHNRSELLGITVSSGGAMAVSQALASGYTLKTNAVSPGQVPRSWVGLAGLDIVVVDHGAWSGAEFPRQAVMDWMAMGGVCLLVDVPREERSPLVAEMEEKAALFVEAAGAEDSFHVGLGGGAFVDREALTRSPGAFFGSLRPIVALNRPSSEFHAADDPEIQGVGDLPFLPVLLALLVFSLLVGPVGWWYLVSKKRMGLLYYAAAPAVSLAAIVLVVAADLTYEGFSPRVSCESLQMLDQRTKRVVEVSQFGVYAPFSIGRELRGTAGELPHFLAMAGRPGWRTGPMSVRPTADGPVYRGVLPARRRVWFGRQAVRVERRRLVVRREEDGIAVENHLERDLRNLLVVFEGDCAHFESLAAGEKRSAPPLPEDEAQKRLTTARVKTVRGTLSPPMEGIARRRQSVWQALLDTGNAYAAEVVGSDPEQVWLDSFRDAGSQNLIMGTF